jgi:hypothetical protein
MGGIANCHPSGTGSEATLHGYMTAKNACSDMEEGFSFFCVLARRLCGEVSTLDKNDFKDIVNRRHPGSVQYLLLRGQGGWQQHQTLPLHLQAFSLLGN